MLAANDGEEALRVARAERPDLVLLDGGMPRLQGFEVLKALKRDAVEQAIALGAEAYLVKAHLSLQDLVPKIDATLASEPA